MNDEEETVMDRIDRQMKKTHDEIDETMDRVFGRKKEEEEEKQEEIEKPPMEEKKNGE